MRYIHRYLGRTIGLVSRASHDICFSQQLRKHLSDQNWFPLVIHFRFLVTRYHIKSRSLTLSISVVYPASQNSAQLVRMVSVKRIIIAASLLLSGVGAAPFPSDALNMATAGVSTTDLVVHESRDLYEAS